MQLEANERQLNPRQILRIDVFNGYDFHELPGYVEYEICDYIVYLAYDEVTGAPVLDDQGVQMFTISKMPVYTGTLDLTLELVNSWGSNDQVIFDYVIQHLP
jgi:hypothetical protein